MFENNFNKKERPLLGLSGLGGGFSSKLTGGAGFYFLASGGTHEFTIASAPSPTGYYRYHVFTGTGSFSINAPSLEADSLTAIVVGGGGPGGGGYPVISGYLNGAGGGAGGRIYATGPTLALDVGTYTVTIGAGGAGPGNGQNTTISTPTSTLITAYGGGRGASWIPGIFSGPVGQPGGSGGGGLHNTNPPPANGGTGFPGQGNPGGTTSYPAVIYDIPGPGAYYMYLAGAGGGAGGSGGNSQGDDTSPYGPGTAGNGGAGAPSPEFSSSLISPYVPTIPLDSWTEIGSGGYFAGGGGAGKGSVYPSFHVSGGLGGIGGGGNGQNYPTGIPGNGYENGFQGTGGGGGGNFSPFKSNGGSGVFMIRYAVPGP